MTTTSSSHEHWTLHVHHLCDVVMRMIALNLLWIVFTIAGGVVLGAAPATAAAARCIREEHLGRGVRLAPMFAATWRTEFVRANLTMLPMFALVGVLGSNYLVLSSFGERAAAVRLLTLTGLVVAVAVTCWLPGLSAHYSLARRRFLTVGLRVALAQPFVSVLLLLITATLVYLSGRIPVLPLVVAFGAWLHLTTWLALRSFIANEDRRAMHVAA